MADHRPQGLEPTVGAAMTGPLVLQGDAGREKVMDHTPPTLLFGGTGHPAPHLQRVEAQKNFGDLKPERA